MQADWELAQSLTSDGQGIRGVAVLPAATASTATETATRLVTGTQGGSLVTYTVATGDLEAASVPHPHAVTAVATYSNNNSSSNNSASPHYYATGCKDAQIRLWDAVSHTLLATCGSDNRSNAHDKPVTSLAWDASGTLLVSGSWDGTAKVWQISPSPVAATSATTTAPLSYTTRLVATLPDHENSVSVAILPASNPHCLQIVTGSAGCAQADNQIRGQAVRRWTVDVRTLEVSLMATVSNDHEGPIRDVCVVGGGGGTPQVATCSNDGTVRLRSLDTLETTAVLTFVPATASSSQPPMLLSVCAVGDDCVAAGAEDGHVVVWQLAAAAPPQILLHPTTVWSVACLETIDSSADLVTACDDGILRVFSRAAERVAPAAARDIWAASVAAAQQSQSHKGPTAEEIAKLPDWALQATVPGTSDGQVQVFRKGAIAIAAQWNLASRTWMEVGQVMGQNDGNDGGGGMVDGVAYDHVLPIEIDLASGEVAKLQIGYSTGENTFTAAQRFMDRHQLPQHYLAQIADYITQRTGAAAPTIGPGGGPPQPAATTGVPGLAYEHLPSPVYYSFCLTAKTVGTLDKIQAKLNLAGVLSETEVTHLASLLETLAAMNRYHASSTSEAQVAVLATLLTKLPPAESFPALDLARMLVLHPSSAQVERQVYWTALLTQAIVLGQSVTDQGPAVPMLSLRLLANAFTGGVGSLAAVVALLPAALTLATQHVPSTNKNVRLSVATFLHNVCFYVHCNKSSCSPALVAQVVPALDALLSTRSLEENAVRRALQALGTLVMADPQAKAAAQQLYLATKVELAASPHSPIVKLTATEVYRVLQ
jgi:phospholipase A-2-activating protein